MADSEPNGQIITDQVVAPREPWSAVIPKGQYLRIVDLEGLQAVDFLCYDAADPKERYCAADTMKISGKIFLETGTVLYSNLANPLFTIVEDTCGRHDTIGGCCSLESNRRRYGVEGQPNCRDNFLTALEPHGLGPKDIVANINFFMYVPVEADGTMAIVDGLSKPGDYIDLRAEREMLAVLSNCPQMNNPATGFNPTPIRVVVWAP
jgi:urea carboxylase-associated protein 1